MAILLPPYLDLRCNNIKAYNVDVVKDTTPSTSSHSFLGMDGTRLAATRFQQQTLYVLTELRVR